MAIADIRADGVTRLGDTGDGLVHLGVAVDDGNFPACRSS